MIKVLVIDDSFFMRQLIPHILTSDTEIKVIDTAKDGHDALEKIPKLKPDCITLDLVMPKLDGLRTLRRIMNEYPTPVIILSAHSKEDAKITMQCLNAGAVSFILKPSGELSLDIENIKDKLIREIKIASKIKISHLRKSYTQKVKKFKYTLVQKNKIVIIGASTGGPQALNALLPSLPADFPSPVIVVQHMPNIIFTVSMAKYLNETCNLPVSVAEDGDVIHEGKIYLIPSGFDANIKDGEIISLVPSPAGAITPSIDITMKTCASFYKAGTIGIILSGMGEDGTNGMSAIKEVSGSTIVQDESSLIFGMPKAVIDLGCADKILPADKITDAIINTLSQEEKK